MGNCGGKDDGKPSGTKPGIGKCCKHCNNEFKSGEEHTILTANGSDVPLHHKCLDPYHRSLGHICKHCNKTITKEMTTLTGEFGKAKLHTDCVAKFRKANKLN